MLIAQNITAGVCFTDLKVDYGGGGGAMTEWTFDLYVISVGFRR